MRIVTNTRLVKRNKNLAQYAFFGSFGILALGFWIGNVFFMPNPSLEMIALSQSLFPFVFIFALLASMFSIRMTNLWFRPPRPETLFEENIKRVGNKAVMYNYFHFPARHVLIAPQGVFAIVTRFQDGKFTVENDRWRSHRNIFTRIMRLLWLDGIGNPTLEAKVAAEHVEKLLEPIAPGVKVQPVIVFLDPRAQFSGEASVPVVHAQSKIEPSLQDYLMELPRGGMPLTPEQIEAFESATLPGGATTKKQRATA